MKRRISHAFDIWKSFKKLYLWYVLSDFIKNRLPFSVTIQDLINFSVNHFIYIFKKLFNPNCFARPRRSRNLQAKTSLKSRVHGSLTQNEYISALLKHFKSNYELKERKSILPGVGFEPKKCNAH